MSYPLLALREEAVKNDDLLPIIWVSEPMSSLSEKYELVAKYCKTSNRTCSEEVYRQIVVDAMGIRWALVLFLGRSSGRMVQGC